MANIAEGFERNRPGEFHQSLSVAKGSCAELRSHLYAAHDAGYLDKKGFTEALAQAEEVGRIIDALRTAVAAQRKSLSMRHEPVQPTQDSGLSTQH